MRVSLSQMVMQADTGIYPGSGKKKPYVQRGEESLYYLAPKCLYRGEYRREMDGDGVWKLYYVCIVLCCVSSTRSRAFPFIVPRRGLGYMYRHQSRGR